MMNPFFDILSEEMRRKVIGCGKMIQYLATPQGISIRIVTPVNKARISHSDNRN